MKITARLRAPLLSVFSLIVAGSLAAQSVLPKSRIPANADLGPKTRLTGHLPRWVTPAADAGVSPEATPVRITLVLSRSVEQETAFTQLLVDQQNPSSPRYHQWLTPSQIGQQFGPTMDDVNAVTGWLTQQQLHVVSVSPSRVFVEVTGTAGTVGAALNTSFHNFLLDGQTRLAAASEPSLPSALAVAVSGIDGLAEIPLKPFHSLMAAEPRGESSGVHPMGSGSNNTVHYVYPGDFAKIYDVTTISGGVYAGTGVKVAIIGRSQITTSDITQLETIAGLPTKAQNTILVPGSADPGLVVGDEDESTLDVGRVLTVSPGAQADLVIAANSSTSGGITAAIQYNVQTLVDPVMTISYGACETAAGLSNVNYFDALFKQGAAEGISTFVSSGDSSAAGCTTSGATPTGTERVGINYLCSSSYVTCVGGTQFNDASSYSTYWSATNSATFTSALGYIPEGAWNEPSYQKTSSGTTTTAYQVLGTGGGPSIYLAKPSWQIGTGVPSDGARDTPDISFTSAGHDPYFACLAYKGSAYNCATGGGTLFYGTSAASPDMAAVAAILVQRTGKSQGNLNPVLYSLAASTPTAFHDATPVSSGVGASCSVSVASMCNNSLPGPSSLSGVAGYPLQVGYDESTGLGSLDVTNFITALAGTAIVGSTTTVTAQPTTILAGKTAVFTATVAGSGSATATGTVQFYSNGTALGSAVTLAGGTASTPATAFNTAGTYSITATYSGDSNYAASTSTAISFVVTTLPPTTTVVTALPTTITAGGSAVFTATLSGTGAATATGTVQFYSNGVALGSAVAVAAGKASTPAQPFAAAGTYAITATYSGDSSNTASTSAALSFVVTAATPVGLSVSASPATLTVAAGATTGNTSTISVTTTASYSGSVALSCTVSYSAGTATYPPTCSLAPASLTFSSAVSGTSVLTVATTVPHAVPGTGQAARRNTLFAPAGGLSFAALLLVLVPSKRRRKMGRLAILPMVLLAAGMMALAGCGSGGSPVTTTTTPVGTSKGTYTVAITATPSAGSAATGTVTLTVQ